MLYAQHRRVIIFMYISYSHKGIYASAATSKRDGKKLPPTTDILAGSSTVSVAFTSMMTEAFLPLIPKLIRMAKSLRILS